MAATELLPLRLLLLLLLALPLKLLAHWVTICMSTLPLVSTMLRHALTAPLSLSGPLGVLLLART
jgi:hypothetical protein